MNREQLTSFVTILEIRRKAYQRNAIIAGCLFLFAILSTIGFGLLTGYDVQPIYTMGGLDILLVVGFLMSWVRLEITKENIELIEHMQSPDR